MPVRSLVLLAMLATPAFAQEPAPPGMPLGEAAARRFPQPVRVGDLIGRRVLRPVESQPTIGRVAAVVARDGKTDIVVNLQGLLPFGARPVAVPADAMVLLGQDMEIVDVTPEQLEQFKTYDGGSAALPLDDTIRVGLARPSH